MAFGVSPQRSPASTRLGRALWLSFGLLLAGVPAWGGDRELLAELRTQLDALQAASRATTDDAEHTRLRAEIDQRIEATLAQLSPDVRPTMAVMFKVVAPAQAAVANYVAGAQVFFASEDPIFATVQARPELGARAARLKVLAEAHAEVATRLNQLEPDTLRVLRSTMELPPAKRMAILSGLADSVLRPLLEMRELRKVEGEVLGHYRAAFDLLDQGWGEWRISADGEIVWAHPETEAAQTWTRLAEQIARGSEQQAVLQARLPLPVTAR